MSQQRSTIEGGWRSFFGGPYRPAVEELAGAYPDRRSLYVDVVDLHDHDAEFANALFAEPDRFLRAAAATLRELHDGFGRVNVRLENNPGLVGVADLGTRHLHELVTVEGAVETVEPVRTAAATAVFGCPSCGETTDTRPTGLRLSDPVGCDGCGWDGALELRHRDSRFVDHQRVTLIEPGADEASGASIDAVLDDDIVGAVEPGDQVLVTGIVRVDREGGSNRFERYLDAVSVSEERGGRDHDALDDVIRSQWESAIDR